MKLSVTVRNLIPIIFKEYSICFTGNYNIALKKTTMQGPKDFCGHGGVCYSSNLAVDGNLNRSASRGACAHTKNDGNTKGSWWSVDFKGGFYLSSIRILRRNECKPNYSFPQFLCMTINIKL